MLNKVAICVIVGNTNSDHKILQSNFVWKHLISHLSEYMFIIMPDVYSGDKNKCKVIMNGT